MQQVDLMSFQLPRTGMGAALPSAEKAQLFASLGSAFPQGGHSAGVSFQEGWAQALALAQGTGAAAVIRPQARLPTAQLLMELTSRVSVAPGGRAGMAHFFGVLLTCLNS